MSGKISFAVLLCLFLATVSSSWLSRKSSNTASSNEDLKIAAFNVQVLGAMKMRDRDVVNVLVQIIQRYDVILIQEIRDSYGEAINSLLENVNSAGNHNYEMVISGKLGRTKSKEQYAFFYRSGIGLDLVSTYQYPDTNNKFERPPFAIMLKVPNPDLRQVALVAIHTSPKNAVTEIDALVDVHEAVRKEWNTDNIVIMGDMNAAPPYVTKKKMPSIRLRDRSYHWLIPDSMDTTLSKTQAAYDRFVVTGRVLENNIVRGSAKAFKFNKAYNLNTRQSKAVSDHFPIEFALKHNGASRKRWYRQQSISNIFDLFNI